MKFFKLIFFSFFLFGYTQNLQGQTILKYIEDEIQNMIYKDSKSWKASEYVYNTLKVNEVNQNDKGIIAEGFFTANITQWPFKGERTIYFTAEIKQVLDDIRVKKIYWTQPITNLYYCIGDCK